jgi:hypothetical protein
MHSEDLNTSRIRVERQMADRSADFMTRYYAVCHLQLLVRDHPQTMTPDSLAALEAVLKEGQYAGRHRGFFLFRQCAETLALVITGAAAQQRLAAGARNVLASVLATATGHAHRTAAEALGSLPFRVRGPRLSEAKSLPLPRLAWREVLAEAGIEISASPRYLGRSLVAPLKGGRRLAVFKLARAADTVGDLLREVHWMERLRAREYAFGVRFDIPQVLRVRRSPVFRLRTWPHPPPRVQALHPERCAIAFIADSDYFAYVNEPRDGCAGAAGWFEEVICRNAWLLGKLTGMGVVHTAPIPLFHNRIQRDRRRDQGRYEWYRAGRLDRWLHSCRYPNMGVTGLRDFEHLISFGAGPLSLYRHIGSHLLSLLLVSGSYFRNRCRDRRGYDGGGRPVDTRSLFDFDLLHRVITKLFEQYYAGFTGTAFKGPHPFQARPLAERMIEEMGVDRYMEELLRVADQQRMTDGDFESFLRLRGYGAQRIAQLHRGREDLVILSGPHLGAFNRPISLPEIIEGVAAMAATCIAGRYWRETYAE